MGWGSPSNPGNVAMKPLALFLLILGMPTAGTAQMGGEREGREATSAEVRDRCEDAVQGLLRGSTEGEPERLLERVMYCEVSGPIALAAAWRTTEITSNPRARLVPISQEIHDVRILNAVLPLLQDPGASYDLRLRAITVLAEYLDPGWRPGSGDWFGGPPGREVPASIGRRTHAVWLQGSQPIDDVARARIVETLNAIAAQVDVTQFHKVANGVEPMSSLGPSDDVRLAIVAHGILFQTRRR